MLGVMIGVAAVVGVVSVGSGAQANVENTLASLQSNQLIVDARSPNPERGGFQKSLPPSEGLSIADYVALRQAVPGISQATVMVSPGIYVVGPGPRTTIFGVDIQGFDVLGRRFKRGSAFGEMDVRAAAGVCVITEHIAREAFGDIDPLGKSLRLANSTFTVIGVMNDAVATNADFRDTSVYVPYTSVFRRLDRSAKTLIILRARDPRELGRIQAETQQVLEQRRGGRIAEFAMTDVAEIVKNQIDASRTLTFALGSIGGIALLVAGIGIMNVMIVSVKERTREIGVRIALGTRAGDVSLQFLLEAAILSLFGGLAGIGLGASAAKGLASVNNWPLLVTPTTIGVAFLCSAISGIFFGYLPARGAAQLDPVQALRAD